MIVFRWHRVGISVRANTVTLIHNCAENETLALNRSTPISELDIDGVIFIARQLLQEDIFVVGTFFSLVAFQLLQNILHMHNGYFFYIMDIPMIFNVISSIWEFLINSAFQVPCWQNLYLSKI